jgi:hypothetical protein
MLWNYYSFEFIDSADQTTTNKTNFSWQDLIQTWDYAEKSFDDPHYPWCNIQHDLKYKQLVYIKIDKAASSTLAGINIRLARKVGSKVAAQQHQSQQDSNNLVCSHTYTHGRASDLLPQTTTNNNKLASLAWWTFLRDPAQRALSEYYHFWVSRKGYGIKYGLVQPFLEDRKNYQLEYIMVHPNPKMALESIAMSNGKPRYYGPTTTATTRTNTGALLLSIRDYIMKPYTFIGIVERMDESLVVMKYLLSVDIGDLIVLSAKESGAYDDGRYNNTCYLIRPKQQQSSLETYQERLRQYVSTDFRKNNFDYVLYDIVNASLDRTIAAIGRDKFDRTLQELRYMRNKVDIECQKEAIFPCSSNGTIQHETSSSNCYWFDSGCGYKCVDRVVESLSL